MLCGIGPKHIRRLCDGLWDGGGGYTPNQVGDMTLDQVYFRLCDRDILRGSEGRKDRIETGVHPGTLTPDKDGFIKGRAADGTPIKAVIKGESLAARVAREEAERAAAQRKADEQQAAQEAKQRRRERRRRKRELKTDEANPEAANP